MALNTKYMVFISPRTFSLVTESALRTHFWKKLRNVNCSGWLWTIRYHGRRTQRLLWRKEIQEWSFYKSWLAYWRNDKHLHTIHSVPSRILMRGLAQLYHWGRVGYLPGRLEESSNEGLKSHRKYWSLLTYLVAFLKAYCTIYEKVTIFIEYFL